MLNVAIPFWWKWAALALLAAGVYATGFVQGRAHEGEKQLALQAKRDDARKVLVRTVTKEVTKIETQFQTRTVYRERLADRVQQQVITHAATLPDPVDCALHADRVRNINESFGFGVASGPGSVAHELRTAPEARLWESSGSGTLGSADGPGLSRLRRWKAGAGGSDSRPPETD